MLLCTSSTERAGWQRDCLAAVGREHLLQKMIAKARRLARLYFPKGVGGGGHNPGVAHVYRALDTRARR